MDMRGFSAAALVTATLLSGATLTGCAAKESVAMSASNKVPAATGQIDVHSDRAGNTRVDVKVKHLAPPENVVPKATSYVVWVKSLEGNRPPENVGALRVNDNRE